MSAPPVPNVATLDLPPQWVAFLQQLQAYASALEARIAALEAKKG